VYLCDSQSSPFILPQQLQRAFRRVEVLSRDGFQHCLRKLDMSIFVFIVGVSRQGTLVALLAYVESTPYRAE
jgi:hypothetical protein